MPRWSVLDAGHVRPNVAIFLAMLLMVSAMAMAQGDIQGNQSIQERWGTSGAPAADAIEFESALAPVSGFISFTNAQFGSGGVGLRNRGAGAIGISGVVTPVKAAYIYWAVITSGSALKPDTQVKLQRLFPTPASSVITITGTKVGTGPPPCWPGNTISVFRGTVPLSVATGNGLYQVTLMSGASGLTNGTDPWIGTPKLPLMEGASLVIVGTGPSGQHVAIYDSGLAGKTFEGNPGLSYSLTLPAKATGKFGSIENIGADGKEGRSRSATSGVGDEKTVINGVKVAGPGSSWNDSDWNGNSAKPLPQLWDDTGHNITAAVPAGTTVLNIKISNNGETVPDCLTPVVNIVGEQ